MMLSRPAALIVEDQPFIGMVASDILRESGFDTFHAYDAADATEQLAAHPEIQVMIVEATLPSGRSGVEFASDVAKANPRLQVLIAAERGRDVGAALPTGARLLLKPFATGDLRTLVAANELA